MTPLLALFDRVIDLLMWIACFCGVLMMGHITVDVFCRNVLNAPLHGTLEIVSAYYMVAISFFPLAYVSRDDGQIFVDLFTQRMAERPKSRLDTLVYGVTTVYLGIFAWRSFVTALDKTDEGEVWETAKGYMAVWPSRWILLVGLLVMALVTLRFTIAGLAGHTVGPKGNAE